MDSATIMEYKENKLYINIGMEKNNIKNKIYKNVQDSIL